MFATTAILQDPSFLATCNLSMAEVVAICSTSAGRNQKQQDSLAALLCANPSYLVLTARSSLGRSFRMEVMVASSKPAERAASSDFCRWWRNAGNVF